MTIHQLLEYTVASRASDLHLLAGFAPTIRVDGELREVPGEEKLTAEKAENLVLSLLNTEKQKLFLTNREADFSVGTAHGRFRVNAYFQKNTLAAALRLIPQRIPTLEELDLPPILKEFTKLKQGLILVTGPTGHGKSTTLAGMINSINLGRSVNIITIEDPIEYLYPPGKSLVTQREMHSDTLAWQTALRSILREDPDVVLIGEMRDFETIAAALTIAETGHLVFATLHTNSASQTIDRVIDVFPPHQQAQIKTQLSGILEAVVSQRLLPKIGGGRMAACEILLGTPAVRNTIREGKTHLLDNMITTGASFGMVSLEAYLAELVKKEKVAVESAMSYSLRPQELERLIKR